MSQQSTAPKNLSPDHLLSLYEISGFMNSTLNFDNVLDNVMDSIMQVTKAQRGFLMIADDEHDALEVLVARGIDGETIEKEGYSTTIVNEVVSTREPLLTNNAQFDTRFQAGASIIMKGLRAILCAPMIVRDNLIGAVYVDTAMRAGAFTPNDMELLKAVCGQAGRAIENARLYRVAVEKGRLERELQMAREIQKGLLPHRMPDVPGYDIVPYWEAAREVAGDFYDAFKLSEDSFGVVMADVSDKGAPAALFMAVARTFIRSNAYSGTPPAETIRNANDSLLDDAEGGMFVTVFHSTFNVDGSSRHVNAGHNPPLLYRKASHSFDYLPTGGRALGWFPDNPVEEVQLQLEPGDFIIYYTDGLTEAENPRGDYYGEERLAAASLEVADRSAQEIRDYILRDVDTFCEDNPPFDDLTMMVVVYTG